MMRAIGFGILLFVFSLPSRADVVLQQADGSRLVLDHPAKTVITLSPHLTELVFAAGAGHQLVATVEYSEFPTDAASIPRVGDAFRLDLERILTLKPDLVIAWQSGNPQQALDRIQALGIPVWTVEIRHPGQIAETLESIGLATGNPETARAAADQSTSKLKLLVNKYSELSPVSYFYQVASHPLYTINGDHLIAQGLALCGGINIFQDAATLAPQVAHESVIAADPQALIAPTGPLQVDPLAVWRDWKKMRAVDSQAMILLPADEISRATPRMLDAIATACSELNTVRINNNYE